MSELPDPSFDRPKVQALPGTVKPYRRHLVVCTGSTDWPAKIDLGGGYLQALSEAISRRAPDMSVRVKLTACDEASAGPGYDILVFPDAVRYRAVQERDFEALVEDHLVGNRVSGRLGHEPLGGRHLFVCVHAARDPRCGACGPPLVEGFQAALRGLGLAGQVVVRGTSHVGGHEYAGNVLIYPGGDWYGYVVPEDIPRILEGHLLRGEIVWERWRGRMGLSAEEQLRLAQAGR